MSTNDDAIVSLGSERPFYAIDRRVFKRPVRTPREGGHSITLGFPVCDVTEWVAPEVVCQAFEHAEMHDDLVGAIPGLLEALDLIGRGLQPNAEWLAAVQVDARALLARAKPTEDTKP